MARRVYSTGVIRIRDIDWFCRVNGVYVHVASAGGSIPNMINDYDVLRPSQRTVAGLDDINNDGEVYINEAFLNELGVNNKYYRQSFVNMAKKGFFSFDRTNIGNPTDDHYHLVAWPNHLVEDVAHIPEVVLRGLDFEDPTHLNNILLVEMIEFAWNEEENI